MDKKIISDLERNNKTVMIAHIIDVAVVTTLCVLQAVSGSLDWLYAAIAAALGFLPVATEFIFWRKNHETLAIKHLAANGFGIFYLFILITATNNMIFVFVIPMILVASLYNDVRYSLLINTITVLESVGIVIAGASTGKFGYTGRDSAVIQIVIMILITLYSFFVARTLNKNMNHKVEKVTEAQNKTELVLNDISQLSSKMKTEIKALYSELEKLNSASKITKEAMQEVSTGATDTAEAVQNQILQTESIQNKVDMVNDAANRIAENMQKTLIVLKNGSRDVDLLVRKVDVSVQNGADVAKKLETLNKYIEEMNSIVELISGITSQTGLLALNASIEAARAGESGKGFAVVATEISKMATQTDEATLHITELIHNISSSISEVVGVIYQMISGINEEKQTTVNTADSFNSIQTNTFSIRDSIETLTSSITELKDANLVIVDSIQTISAISEEVSAHASETMTAEEDNAEILETIASKMEELIKLVDR
ncbi:MAG: chemotaxis protein [Lachnospiraceae bacterium]|nr:chemotaxis protein [Lachnospiraceae bacterium]